MKRGHSCYCSRCGKDTDLQEMVQSSWMCVSCASTADYYCPRHGKPILKPGDHCTTGINTEQHCYVCGSADGLRGCYALAHVTCKKPQKCPLCKHQGLYCTECELPVWWDYQCMCQDADPPVGDRPRCPYCYYGIAELYSFHNVEKQISLIVAASQGDPATPFYKFPKHILMQIFAYLRNAHPFVPFRDSAYM